MTYGSFVCFMVAAILLAVLILTSIFSHGSGDQWKDAVINILVLNWISTLAVLGMLLRKR